MSQCSPGFTVTFNSFPVSLLVVVEVLEACKNDATALRNNNLVDWVLLIVTEVDISVPILAISSIPTVAPSGYHADVVD